MSLPCAPQAEPEPAMEALVLALWVLLAGPAAVSVQRGRGAARLDLADHRARTGEGLAGPGPLPPPLPGAGRIPAAAAPQAGT